MFYSHLRKHIEYVEELGCNVGRNPLLPSWVYSVLPQQVHPFLPKGSVCWILLPRNASLSDAEVEPILRYFPNLISLDLTGTGITDSFLKRVSMHSKLEVIYLDGTNVTDEGVAFLSKSRSLTRVFLKGTGITDASVVHLSQMKQLRALWVTNTRVTDKSVEVLCQMPNLVDYNTSDTQISNEGQMRLWEEIKER